MLGATAKDGGPAIAAFPKQASGHVTQAAERFEKASAAGTPDQTVTSGDRLIPMARSSAYVRGRDLVDEVDYSELRWTRRPGSSGNSSAFEEIQRLQGFCGPVTTVTRPEVDAVITPGRPPLFRGFEEDRYIDDFIEGPVRPGGGPSGSGTYVTPLESVAFDYTDPTRTQELAARQARVVLMALRPEARVITLDALITQRDHALTRIDDELRVLRTTADPTDEETTRRIALQDKQLTFADIGQFGALCGWDAIDGSSAFSDKQWVILNPTALLVHHR